MKKTEQISFFTYLWLGFLSIFPLFLLNFFLITPRLISAPNTEELSRHFLDYVVIRGLAPEPLEQLRYITTIVIISLSMLIICLGWKKLHHKINSKYSFWLVIFTQICFLGWIIERQLSELVRGETFYFNDFGIGNLYWITFFILTIYFFVKTKKKIPGSFTNKYLPLLIGFFYLILQLSTGLFQSRDLPQLANSIYYHMTFTMGEFAAVLNNRTLLVNVFPQYQNLMAYFLAPVFHLLDLSIGSFTLVMTLLSFLALIAWFAVLIKIVKNRWLALGLFLPIVAMSCLSVDMKDNLFRNNFFTYHAVANLRSVGPWLLCFLSVWYLEAASKFRFLVIAIFSALVAINNIDFGIPAYIATFFVITMHSYEIHEGVAGWFRKKTLGLFIKYFGIGFIVLCSYFLFTYLKSEGLPNVGQLFNFQKIFAISGFYMLRIPRVGYQWNIMFTFLAALVVSMARIENGINKTTDERKISGLLMYFGIFGAGSFMYYVGRSHTQVLMSFFPVWTFTFIILAWLQFKSLSINWSKMKSEEKWLNMPTSIFLFLHLCIFIFAIPSVPSIKGRLSLSTSQIKPQHDLTQLSLVKLIKKYSSPGEIVGIIYPMGFNLARSASVINVFPFIQDESLLIKEQVSITIKVFDDKKISIIFGKFPTEMRLILETKNYSKIDHLEDFEVWKKITQ